LSTNYLVVTNGSTALAGGAGKSFKILSLGTNNVRVVDPSLNTADDRGGIALAGSRVFLRGDQFTASYAAEDLSSGTRLWTNHNGQCWISSMPCARIWPASRPTCWPMPKVNSASTAAPSPG